jgi:cytochrome c
MKIYITVFVFIFLLNLISCKEKISNTAISSYDTTQWPSSFGLGRVATVKEIDSLDFDVRPDGKGLPQGEGTYAQGKIIYQEKCSLCHGKNGNDGPYNKLVIAPQSKDDKRGEKTIGNYWPYASTVYDYVHRAMPYDHPGSLTNDEVYSITAFLLAKNKIIDSTLVLNAKNLSSVIMPAQKLFVNDDRKGGSEIR